MPRIHSAGSARDVPEGGMVEREVAGRPVLLCRAGGQIRALGGRCTHHGAPLAEGALDGTTIVCPWHHAKFDATTGARLAAPALDPIAAFHAEVRGDEIWITLPDGDEAPRPAAFDPAVRDARTFVMVGAGAAGQAAAEHLREVGFAGRVVLITAEDELPYDRTVLSKGFAAGQARPEDLPLRDAAFYEERGVELMLGRRVTHLDAASRRVTLEDGDSIGYDAALVAPGGRPRALDVPGAEGVMLLRDAGDARRLADAAGRARRAVLIGSGFVGMELAASLRSRGLEVQVVSRDSEPFERALGPEVGGFFRRLHESKGVRFHRNVGVGSITKTAAGAVVALSDGSHVEADMVVAGVGVSPATEFVDGVEKDAAGAIVVDAALRAAPGLWAAGDVALYPHAPSGRRVRVEHWRLAQQHGRHAARGMAGDATPFTEAPFFWSEQYDSGLTYVGHAADGAEPEIDGSPEEGSFIAYYLDGDRVAAAAGVWRDEEMARLQAEMDRGVVVLR